MSKELVPESAQPASELDEIRERNRHADGVYKYIDHRAIDDEFFESLNKLKTSPLLSKEISNPMIEMFAKIAIDYSQDPYKSFIATFSEYMGIPVKDVLAKEESMRGK